MQIAIFKVYVDRVVVNSDGYKTFSEASKIVFALYSIMNTKLPRTYYVTMEFIERYFLKIHPDSGSKPKLIGSTKKIFNLMNKFKEFEITIS